MESAGKSTKKACMKRVVVVEPTSKHKEVNQRLFLSLSTVMTYFVGGAKLATASDISAVVLGTGVSRRVCKIQQNGSSRHLL